MSGAGGFANAASTGPLNCLVFRVYRKIRYFPCNVASSFPNNKRPIKLFNKNLIDGIIVRSFLRVGDVTIESAIPS